MSKYRIEVYDPASKEVHVGIGISKPKAIASLPEPVRKLPNIDVALQTCSNRLRMNTEITRTNCCDPGGRYTVTIIRMG